MVLSLATREIEPCPCGDLHVVTAAPAGLSFRVRRCLSGRKGAKAPWCPAVPMGRGRGVLRVALAGHPAGASSAVPQGCAAPRKRLRSGCASRSLGQKLLRYTLSPRACPHSQVFLSWKVMAHVPQHVAGWGFSVCSCACSLLRARIPTRVLVQRTFQLNQPLQWC